MPTLETSPPPYRQIVRYISERIARGDLAPGEKLPSERQLMDEWRISKATANKVVSTLKADGLVETRVGVGTLVADTSGQVAIGPRDMFGRIKHEGRIRLPSERSEKIIDQVIGYDAPSHVVAALEATRESDLIRRYRVIFRDEKPYCVAVSWFLPAIIAQTDREIEDRLLDSEPISEGTPQFIAQRLGRSLDDVVDYAEAVAATDRLAKELGQPVGAPMLRIVSTICAEGWPIEVGEYFYPAHAGVTYHYEL